MTVKCPVCEGFSMKSTAEEAAAECPEATRRPPADDTAKEVIALWLDEQFGARSKQENKTRATKLVERLRGSQIGFQWHGRVSPDA